MSCESNACDRQISMGECADVPLRVDSRGLPQKIKIWGRESLMADRLHVMAPVRPNQNIGARGSAPNNPKIQN